MKEKSITQIILHILILFSLQFFQWNVIRGDNFKYVHFFLFSLILVISISFYLKNNVGLTFAVKLLLFSELISIFVNYFTWGQSLFDSLLVVLPVFTTIYAFFFFVKYRISPKQIEKIIVFYGFVYLTLYIFQLINSDSVYFGWANNFQIEGNLIRIIFPGYGIFYLTILIALSKFRGKIKDNKKWFILIVLGFIVPILQITRQQILAISLIYLIHFIRNQNWKSKIFGVSLLAVSFYSFSNSEIANKIGEYNKRDVELGVEYVRIQAMNYFLNDFSPSYSNVIFGNGKPRNNSIYGKVVFDLEKNEGYYISDVGLVGVYTMFGVFSVISYLIIWYKSFTVKIPDGYQYIKYYLWMLLITSLTSDFVFSDNSLISNIMVIYLLHYFALKNTNKSPYF